MRQEIVGIRQSEGYSGEGGTFEVWGDEEEWRSVLLCGAAEWSVVVLRAVAARGLRVVVLLQTERRGRQEHSCQAKNRDESVQWPIHLFYVLTSPAGQKIHAAPN